jgi:hypothetical protein
MRITSDVSAYLPREGPWQWRGHVFLVSPVIPPPCGPIRIAGRAGTRWIFKAHVQCVVQEERVAYRGTGGDLLLASWSRVHTACLAGLASVVSSLGPSCTPASTRSMHDLWQRVERFLKAP